MLDYELAVLMHDWHRSGGCPVYAVGSSLVTGEESTQEMYEAAIGDLRFTLRSEDNEDLRDELTRLIEALERRKEQALIPFDVNVLRRFASEEFSFALCSAGFKLAHTLLDGTDHSVRSAVQKYLNYFGYRHNHLPSEYWVVFDALVCLISDPSWIWRVVELSYEGIIKTVEPLSYENHEKILYKVCQPPLLYGSGVDIELFDDAFTTAERYSFPGIPDDLENDLGNVGDCISSVADIWRDRDLGYNNLIQRALDIAITAYEAELKEGQG